MNYCLKYIWMLLMAIPIFGKSQSHEVCISTNLGDMTFILFDDTPKHRDAFLQLAREGYYDGTLFYRVMKDFLIQGGSKSSKNAAKSKRIGYGDPDKTVNDEILSRRFHQFGALCAPRQPDDINPFKQSDISQFYIIKGKVHSAGLLDTLEMVVNNPIKKRINEKYLTPQVREKLAQLKSEKKVEEFRAIADPIREQIEVEYAMHPGILKFSAEQREAYTNRGGYPDLDGKYTVFGQCTSGWEVIDKISKLKTDENNRPFTDVKIIVKVLK